MSLQDLSNTPQFEVLQSLDGFVAERLTLLLPVERAWQPTDFLPDLTGEDWRERVEALRAPARGLPDEFLVCLVGGMVTEEALPNYSIALNNIAQDYTGEASTGWAKWMRGWSAEENRHGDLLNAYLRLTGRVDMRSVERTVHHLITRGFNPKAYTNVYGGLIYTSFQERATSIAHNNVGRLAAANGDAALAGMCRRIAGDESRHESFYSQVMAEVMRVDPAGAVLAMKMMLKSMISMPGQYMTDGRDPGLFDHFAAVSQRLGVYTIHDYAAIIGHLVTTWGVAGLSLSGEAAKAQAYLCKQRDRYESLAAMVDERVAAQPRVKFEWIFGREA